MAKGPTDVNFKISQLLLSLSTWSVMLSIDGYVRINSVSKYLSADTSELTEL